ncbi:unnamed protein product [Merluccius merluccius]
MLEHYQQHEEISKVLKDYAYDESFPPNPNAHVYLYRHLKKRNAPEKKLRSVLKVLHDLVPSHELMLEYFAILLRSDNWNDIVGEKMASRRDWWPAFHFTYFHAQEDLTTDPKLLRVKSWLCRLLFPVRHMSKLFTGCLFLPGRAVGTSTEVDGVT